MERSTLRRLLAGRSGNIAVITALTLPALGGILAIGVDFGQLTMQRREVQALADLTAIVAASNPNRAIELVQDHLRSNHADMVISTADGWINAQGRRIPPELATDKMGRVTIELGHYVPKSDLAVDQRFQPGATPTDAVRITIERQGRMSFASAFTEAPMLKATGTAMMQRNAAFSLGSRLATLDGGLLNMLLGRMLGTTLSLRAVDYRALVDADIDIFILSRQLASNLSLTAGRYEQVLDSQITLPQFLQALMAPTVGPSGAQDALNRLSQAASSLTARFRLGDLIDLAANGRKSLKGSPAASMRVGLLELIQAAAILSNGQHIVSVDMQAGLPGLGVVHADLAIGEPPVVTPPYRYDEIGAVAHTSQVRLALTVEIKGLLELAGTSIRLPLYIEIAPAKAQLAAIQCWRGSRDRAEVSLNVLPGVASVAIGEIDRSSLSNFVRTPTVKAARLLEAPAVAIDASSATSAVSSRVQALTFSPLEIAAGTGKSVSSRGLVGSITASALDSPDVRVRLLMLSIGTPQAIQNALVKTLSSAAPALDLLVDRLLASLGVRLGEADLRVVSSDCANPVLVQ